LTTRRAVALHQERGGAQERGARYARHYISASAFLLSLEGKMDQDLDTNRIKDWRSIVTLVVFVFASKFLLRDHLLLPLSNRWS
jgi:hypothetical protein